LVFVRTKRIGNRERSEEDRLWNVEGHVCGAIPSEDKAKYFQGCGVEQAGCDQLPAEETVRKDEGLGFREGTGWRPHIVWVGRNI
jgi:hypothetical protein